MISSIKVSRKYKQRQQKIDQWILSQVDKIKEGELVWITWDASGDEYVYDFSTYEYVYKFMGFSCDQHLLILQRYGTIIIPQWSS